jgi:hypothetical protein
MPGSTVEIIINTNPNLQLGSIVALDEEGNEVGRAEINMSQNGGN